MLFFFSFSSYYKMANVYLFLVMFFFFNFVHAHYFVIDNYAKLFRWVSYFFNLILIESFSRIVHPSCYFPSAFAFETLCLGRKEDAMHVALFMLQIYCHRCKRVSFLAKTAQKTQFTVGEKAEFSSFSFLNCRETLWCASFRYMVI